jgi:TetR/AcrR family transcriptional repressor of nem operon
MPRVKLFNEEDALSKAMLLFWEKGYQSTSLTDLTKTLGISKGSFYATFTSKRELFENAFQLYRKSNIEALQTLLASEFNVKSGIEKLFKFSLEEALNDKSRKGCFVANICSELGGRDAEIRSQLKDHHRLMHDSITNYIQKEPQTKGLTASQIADVYITFLTGINQEVKIRSDKQRFLKSIDAMLQFLG